MTRICVNLKRLFVNLKQLVIDGDLRQFEACRSSRSIATTAKLKQSERNSWEWGLRCRMNHAQHELRVCAASGPCCGRQPGPLRGKKLPLQREDIVFKRYSGWWWENPKIQKSQNPKIQKSKNQRSRGMRLHRQTGLEATGVQRPPARGLGGLRPICCQPAGSPGAAPKLCVEVARASGCVFDSCAQLLVVPPFAWTDPTTARRCATTARPQRRCSNSRDATARLQRQGSNCEAPTARLRRRGSNGVAPTAGLRRTATL